MIRKMMVKGDAFPFYKNEVLNQIFDRCCLNNYVKMSATFNEDDRNGEELLILNRRYHGYNLPVPHVILISHFFQEIIIFFLLKMLAKKTIIFVPTIKDIIIVSTLLESTSFKYGIVSSLHQNNQTVISQLKSGEIDCIISTTLLERGVTIEDVQVIVFKGEHVIFDERTLIQIAGRVGRKPAHPTGKIYILASEKTKSISRCVSTIKKLNTMNV